MTAALDRFKTSITHLGDPCSHAEAVTPSDTADLVQVSRFLYVGTGGTLTVITPQDGTVSLGTVAAGSLLPLRVSRVKATGTTATNIIAMA